MDDTMSSYSFSHQFYQRWTCAPEPIRAAITQELKDITTLLQNDTPFESFVFNTHDLDTHIDELYENHEAEQAIAKAITDKKAEEQATAEKQQREEQQKIKAAEDARLKESARLKEAADTAQKEQQKTEQIAAEKNNLADKTTAMNTNDASDSESLSIDNTVEKNQNVEKSAATQSSSENKTISEHANVANDKHINDDHSIKAVNDKASAAIKLALKDAKLSTTHQEMIRELEMQIDDYLSEQMMLMSENLKSWLRAEVTQNLSEDEAVTDKESKKS
ncbi:hypothetical protein JCM18902_1687 [Psychrobacter sp. JCM 18902]|uniref:hypothetical protein n=1 Tax=Psychrobacter sp. JCM 18902 TaxID=1298607 RepID=UPI000432015A|nr:hypothetical protein [Psychrobacter sp. JCM 18902]GAF58868.1 hypothetical protein JCM18902_1687 [Psychrobacter sp. JCM 18902]